MEVNRPEDNKKPNGLTRRGFLEGVGALTAAVAVGGVPNPVEAQSVPMSVEKLPAGTVEVLARVKQLTGNRETGDLPQIINALVEDGTLDLGLRNANEKGRARELIMGSILDWNLYQTLSDRVAFQEFATSPGEYTPMSRGNGVVPLAHLRSLHINARALKKFLEDPESHKKR